MSTPILLQVPDDIYRRVKTVAIRTQRDVAEVLLESITRSFVPFPVDPNRAGMNQNVEAFHALHPTLVETYLGQFVAIHEGQLVDHDSDPISLLQRVRARYPNRVVLRRKVESVPERELRINHPQIEVNA